VDQLFSDADLDWRDSERIRLTVGGAAMVRLPEVG